MLRSTSFCAVFCLAASLLLGAQDASKDDTFTLTVAPPTNANEVQVRYVFTGGSAGHVSSVATPTKDGRILIKTAAEDKLATSFRLVAFAPGCELVTVSVDDLSSSRQADFRCTPLNTVQFNGRLSNSLLGKDSLRVQALYNCDWCPKFFGMPQGALSPFTLGKADVASDGTFIFDLPNFSADPLWSTYSNSSSLTFYALDANNGKPVASLKAQGGSSKAGAIPVAPLYDEVEFTRAN